MVVEKHGHGAGKPVWELESPLRGGLRSIAGAFGRDPDFIVLGAQRAGTTSLHRWLSGRSDVRMSEPKELHYFDLQLFRGPRWYRSHFLGGRGRLLGEATPYYLFHPTVPARISAALPEARFVVSLRDPVSRAYSQFRHERDLGFEPLESFEEALALEAERLEGEAERLEADPAAVSYAHNHFSYFARGRYASQLERWFAAVPREQIHVVFAEDMFTAPEATLGALCDFLGLDRTGCGPLPRMNAASGPKLSLSTRNELEERYAADDAALETLLGRRVPWRSS